MRHHFRIPIGDWSGDGHSHCDWYDATAAKPIEDVREAYFAARKNKKLKKVCPEEFCNQYQDATIPKDVWQELERLGAPMPVLEDPEDGIDDDCMAALVVWFINQGDPDIDVRLDPKVTVPMLPFYGFDKKKRHIGFMGYGLFYD